MKLIYLFPLSMGFVALIFILLHLIMLVLIKEIIIYESSRLILFGEIALTVLALFFYSNLIKDLITRDL